MEKNESSNDQLLSLFEAARTGDIEKLKELAAAGADINAAAGMTAQLKSAVDGRRLGTGGSTALNIAVSYGQAEFVKALLSLGANPNVADRDRMTPLMFAVRQHDAAIVQLLIEGGANVNATDQQGFTALHFAFDRGDSGLDVVRLLIDAGADVNAAEKGCPERTPLSEAAWNDAVEGVKLLLKAGADPAKGSWAGQGLVHAEHSPEILKLLQDASSNPHHQWPSSKGRGR